MDINASIGEAERRAQDLSDSETLGVLRQRRKYVFDLEQAFAQGQISEEEMRVLTEKATRDCEVMIDNSSQRRQNLVQYLGRIADSTSNVISQNVLK